MKLAEYAAYDALGLAELVRSREVSPRELRETALRAIEVGNRALNAIIETYADGAPGANASTDPEGRFAGVPFLVKDVGLHFRGIKCEFCSRLCEGMVAPADSHYASLVKGTGVDIVGRTNTPEFSMSGTSENLLYGNTSTPWMKDHSANGSTGGGAAAVSAGIVPIAHGSDIGGSIRGPAAWVRRRWLEAFTRAHFVGSLLRRVGARHVDDLRADQDHARHRGDAGLPRDPAAGGPFRHRASGGAVCRLREASAVPTAHRILGCPPHGCSGRPGDRGRGGRNRALSRQSGPTR